MACQSSTNSAASTDQISFLVVAEVTHASRLSLSPAGFFWGRKLCDPDRSPCSLVGMERFGKSQPHSTLRLLLAKLDVPGFESLLCDWIAVQSAIGERPRQHGLRYQRLPQSISYGAARLHRSDSLRCSALWAPVDCVFIAPVEPLRPVAEGGDRPDRLLHHRWQRNSGAAAAAGMRGARWGTGAAIRVVCKQPFPSFSPNATPTRSLP